MTTLLSKLSLETQPEINIARMCRHNLKLHKSSVLTFRLTKGREFWAVHYLEKWAQVWLYMLSPEEHACFYLPTVCQYYIFVDEIEAMEILTFFFVL